MKKALILIMFLEAGRLLIGAQGAGGAGPARLLWLLASGRAQPWPTA